MSNSLDQIEAKYAREFNAMDDWIDDKYNKFFEQYFSIQREIHIRLLKSAEKITDDELEDVLIDVPLLLIDANSMLNKYRLRVESLKIQIKYCKLYENSDQKEIHDLENKLLISAYDALINRVEKEMSYSRELIMSAKKVWDSRRNKVDIIIDTDDKSSTKIDLPEYQF